MARSRVTFVAPIGVVLTGLLAACGSASGPEYPSSGSPPARLDRSGSRLQVRGHEADGVFVVDGLYDTKLDLMCVPAIASDGVERCVPRDVRPLGPLADAIDAGPDYSDACSTPLVTIPKTACADPSRVIIRSSQPGSRTRDGASYWRIGPSKSPAKVYHPAMGECVEGIPEPANDYFERGAPIPPTELVAFVRRDVAVSRALRAVVLEGADGSRLQAERAFIDVARGKPCELALTEDNVLRCAPASASLYEDRTFTDADCHTPAAIGICGSRLGQCDDLTVIERIEGPASDVCVPDRYRFYAAGPRVATGDVRFGSGPSECSTPIKQSSTIVEVGPSIAPTEFPPVESGSTRPRSRLTERTLLVGGTPVKQAAVFDSQIDDECRFERAADGKVRCLPVHAAVALAAFADAACTTPLFASRDACQSVPKHARIVEGSACDPVVRIHTITVATQAFERRDGACVEAPIYPGTFVAGDEVPATAFLEGTPSTR